MQPTEIQKNKIRLIIQKLIEKDEHWFNQQEIVVGCKPPYWILNYNQGARNEYNCLVRGMVVRIPNRVWLEVYKLSQIDPLSLIVSFPFMRFFNYEETEAAPVDFSNAEMIEKLDGTMVGVFFPNELSPPTWHTRRMISSWIPDSDLVIRGFDRKSEYKFIPIIGEYVKNLTFDNDIDHNYTYVFEFIHDASKVLTQYSEDQYGLYLIGARNTAHMFKDYKELTEEQLDKVAKRIGAKRPRRWHVGNDHEKIQEILEKEAELIPNFEGAVFRDAQGERVKVKREDYVKLHHLLDQLSYKRLIPIILQGEGEEIIAYFPHARELVDNFKASLDNFVESIVQKIAYWKSQNLSKKDLALTLLGRHAKRWDAETGAPTEKVIAAEPNSWIASKILACIDQTPEEIAIYVLNDIHGIGKGITLTGKKMNLCPKKVAELLSLQEEENCYWIEE